MTQQQMEFYTSKTLIFNRQGNMYQPETKHEFCLFFANMLPMTPATIFISLFVLDTPAFLPAIRNNNFMAGKGKSSGGWLLTSSTGKFPSEDLSELPSFVAVFITHDFMTGQEYHCACCLLSPCQQQAGSYNLIFFARQNGLELA